MENPRETSAYQLSRLGRALAVLAELMKPDEAANLAGRGAQALVRRLESPEKTDSDRLSSLANALVGLTVWTDPKEATNLASRGAQSLVERLKNPDEMDSDRLSSLGSVLAMLARQLPHARQTQLLALSNVLLTVSRPPTQGEKTTEEQEKFAALRAALGPQELAEVLKWPFCVGEPQRMVFAELEKKTGARFDGDLWKFVEQAPALGIKDIEAPAKRPRMEDALAELKGLAAGKGGAVTNDPK
jgi:hypothetical protein